MAFCLSPLGVSTLKKAFKNGDITTEKLKDLGPDGRHDYFVKLLGQDAGPKVNALMESKLLLKNQERGVITAAKKAFGEGTPDYRNAVAKITKMDKILSPDDRSEFMSDLAASRLGAKKVSLSQAEEVLRLAKAAESSKEKLAANLQDYDSIVDYGKKYLDLTDYVNSLKPQGNPWADIKQWLGLPQSALTSVLHLSAPFVQGYGMIGTKAWFEGFPKMIKYLFNDNSYRELNAYIVAHPDYKLAMSAKLGLTKLGDKLSEREEAIFSSLLEHVPGVKVAVKASNRAFTGYNNYLRFTSFSRMMDAGRLSGQEITPAFARDVARLVNDFTGRGALGKDDRYASLSPVANMAFFSPRGISAVMNMFNPVKYVKYDPMVRMQAMKQLGGMVIATSAILGLAALSGAKINLTNPKKNDFLEFSFGKTTFNPTGRIGSYIKFWASMLTGEKTSRDNITYELGKGFGSETRLDLLVNFFRNKLAPVAGTVADALSGKEASGEKPTLQNEAYGKFVPITVQDWINMAVHDPNNLRAIIASPLAAFGLQMKTEVPYNQDWNNSTSKELKQFHSEVGTKTFKEANDAYNAKIEELHEGLQDNDEYKNMSDEDKKAYIIGQKTQIKKDVFNDYGFTYRREEQ